MSSWETISKVLPLAISGTGILVSITSALLSATNVGRQAPGAFRRVTGYLLAGVGFVALTVGLAVWALTVKNWDTRWTSADTPIATGATIGLVLLVTGVRRARNAPVDRDSETLSLLARAMLDRLGQTESATSPFGTTRAELRVTRTSETVAESLLSASDLVTILVGPAGCGKSTSMRTMARDICRKAMASRSPEIMAIYVDLANLTASPAAPTAKDISTLILDEVSGGYQTIRDKLKESLDGDADRANWLFLFDSFDEISSLWSTGRTSVITADFLNELHHFLRPGGARFRAVVATRDDVTLPPGTRMTGIAPLTHAAQRKLIEKTGIENKHALVRLRQSAGEIAGRPLALGLWCEEMLSDATARARALDFTSVDELVQATVDARLRRAAASTKLSFDELQAIADDVAALIANGLEPRSAYARTRMVSELERQSGRTAKELEAGLDALIASGLATGGRPRTFTFSHRSFQDLCGARWLIRSVLAADLDAILGEKRWSSSITLALEMGPDDFRQTLLNHASTRAAVLSGCLLNDIDKYLAIGPASALPLVFDPSGTTPELDPRLIHVISIAAALPVDSLAMAPRDLRDLADRLMVTAFVRGDVMERQSVLAVARLLTPKVAAWTVERTVRHGGWLLETAATAMSRAPLKVSDLDLRTRLILLGEIATKPVLLRTIATRPSPDGDQPTLPVVARAMIWVLRVGSLLVAIACMYGLLRSRTSADALFPGVGAAFSGIILRMTYLHEDRQEIEPELGFGSAFAILSAIFAVVAAIMVPVFLIQLVSGRLGAVLALAVLYLLSWPFFMAVSLLVEPPPFSRQGQIPPHWVVVRNISAFAVLLPPMPIRRLLTQAIVAVATIAALIYLANGPIPFVAGQVETRTRQIIAGVLLLGLLLFLGQHSSRRDKLFQRELRRGIADGTLSTQALQKHLMEIGGGERRMRLLVTELGHAPAEGLRSCERVIIDLARALDHVKRIVPASTTTRIPAAVWELDQRLTGPEIRRWLEDFDAAHPGRLTWLAANHGDSFARIAGGLLR